MDRRSGVGTDLRDSVFNRGAGGAARVLQRALGIGDDGEIGAQTQGAMEAAEGNAPALLQKLRAAREQYERDVVGYRPEFWTGLVNRCNNAAEIAKTFPMTRSASPPLPVPVPTCSFYRLILPFLRRCRSRRNRGLPSRCRRCAWACMARVAAWQTFLLGQGFGGGPTDGYFGEHTRDATKLFQHKYKLAEDGVAGRETLLKAAALGFELIEATGRRYHKLEFPATPEG